MTVEKSCRMSFAAVALAVWNIPSKWWSYTSLLGRSVAFMTVICGSLKAGGVLILFSHQGAMMKA
jgi:hypothetical protein